MTHEMQPNGEAKRGGRVPGLLEGVQFGPSDALRASPVEAPYEDTEDGDRSPAADEYDAGQLMIARLQAEEQAEVHGR
jgi:hypothetical protein